MLKRYITSLIIVLTLISSSSVVFAHTEGNAEHKEDNLSNVIGQFRGDDSNSNMKISHSGGEMQAEVPPNYPVLATFGIINLLFLCIGVGLRIQKRKEQHHGS